MRNTIGKGLTFASCWLGAIATIADADEVRTLRSGNGSIGSTDTQVHFVSASGPFNTGNFAAARSGAAAFIVDRHVGGSAATTWLTTLPADPMARWIAIGPQRQFGDALYAQAVEIASSQVCDATLVLQYAVDDTLGDTAVPGIYLNEAPVPGATQLSGGFTGQTTFSSDAIGLLLHPGTNTLYLFQNDTAMVVAGVMFSATITVESGPRITVQPPNRLSCPGGTASFTTAVTGSGADTFRWEWRAINGAGTWTAVVNGSNSADGVAFTTSGASAAQLTVSALLGAPFSIFAVPVLQVRCAASNQCGEKTSAPATLTICPADFDCNGTTTVQDLFNFLVLWFSNDTRADFNRADGVSLQDAFDFLAAYFTGCP